MTIQETTLTAGDAEVTVQPGNGCRVSSLRIGGTELLRQGERYGCFPMVPWCGRVRDGRFRDGGQTYRMPLNSPPHAIHGFARDAEWTTARASADDAVFTYDLAEPWPWPGRVTQMVRLTEDSLTLTLGIETYGDSFPAQAGFGTPGSTGPSTAPRTACASTSPRPGRRSAATTTSPPAAWIERADGPWDDCFGMPDGVDVTLTWPGRFEVKVASREQWVVVYDEQEAAVCVEPQTGPPDGLNTLPRLVTPVDPLEATTTWTWRAL